MGNSSPEKVCLYRALAWLCPPCWWMNCFLKTAEVRPGSVRMMEDGRGGFDFLGNSGPQQGIHLYWDLFYRVGQTSSSTSRPASTRSPSTMATSGSSSCRRSSAQDMGQPVLLPPGMHQWRSATMRFDACVDLTQPVISLGPYTLLTVDKGYEAVTQNNGKQEVLAGGEESISSPTATTNSRSSSRARSRRTI